MRHIPRRLLTPTETGILKNEIKELETQLFNPEMVGLGVWGPNQNIHQGHRGKTQSRLNYLKKQLESGSVEKFSRSEIMRRDKRIKELEESLGKRMVPSEYHHAKRGDSKDYNKTVDHLVKVEMGADFQRDAQELKNLLRAREQHGARLAGSVQNPNSASLEYLRQ